MQRFFAAKCSNFMFNCRKPAVTLTDVSSILLKRPDWIQFVSDCDFAEPKFFLLFDHPHIPAECASSRSGIQTQFADKP
jgi:hypothetical protein